jgi:hypothetical protein
MQVHWGYINFHHILVLVGRHKCLRINLYNEVSSLRSTRDATVPRRPQHILRHTHSIIAKIAQHILRQIFEPGDHIATRELEGEVVQGRACHVDVLRFD